MIFTNSVNRTRKANKTVIYYTFDSTACHRRFTGRMRLRLVVRLNRSCSNRIVGYSLTMSNYIIAMRECCSKIGRVVQRDRCSVKTSCCRLNTQQATTTNTILEMMRILAINRLNGAFFMDL